MTKTTLTPRRHIRKTPRSVIDNKESVYNCFSTLKIAQNYLQTLEALRTKMFAHKSTVKMSCKNLINCLFKSEKNYRKSFGFAMYSIWHRRLFLHMTDNAKLHVTKSFIK